MLNHKFQNNKKYKILNNKFEEYNSKNIKSLDLLIIN